MARPSTYSEIIAQEICEAISTTPQGLNRICSENDSFPCKSTIYQWLERHPDFRERYTRARELQADVLFEECMEIADTPLPGVVEKETPNGIEVTREDMLGHRRLQIDTRKWMIAKLAPKKYGTDKQEVTHLPGDTLTEFLGKLRAGVA